MGCHTLQQSPIPSRRTLFINLQYLSQREHKTMFLRFAMLSCLQWRTSWLTNTYKQKKIKGRGLDPWFPLLVSFLQGSINIQNVFPTVWVCLKMPRILYPPPNQFLLSEAGVIKKLSLAGLAKLSWFGLASASYRGLGVHDRPVYTAG
jgi:hypothetical protein